VPKDYLQLECFFVILGSTRAKAARRTLMKLTPDNGGLILRSSNFLQLPGMPQQSQKYFKSDSKIK